MCVIQCLSIHILVKQGNHVLVRICIEMMDFVTSMPTMSDYVMRGTCNKSPTVELGGAFTIADEMTYPLNPGQNGNLTLVMYR